ncbi:hypothetical protein AURDEDRAFT_187855 [Auricularia subglabra TFB-10046 SS5]|uniref:Uncharacterized protein n=1 Tax=Auricularia subglabra (strain TFB-10046 / SS5) TaxID=717982 RepID=J0D0Y5_AURST|nr:hypothetical protein AURDEDRAFT_187855 [Auricularia subglabra TFB-10046 SS5]
MQGSWGMTATAWPRQRQDAAQQVNLLAAQVSRREAKLEAKPKSPSPRPSSSRPTLVNSQQKRKALGAAPLARALHPQTGAAARAEVHVLLAAPPIVPALEFFAATNIVLEDGITGQHRERDRLGALPAHPKPGRILSRRALEAECVRLRRRARNLEADAVSGAYHSNDGPHEKAPDTTVWPARPLPPIDLRPSSRTSPPVQQSYPAQSLHPSYAASDALDPHRAAPGLRDQRVAHTGPGRRRRVRARDGRAARLRGAADA